jgi:DNA-binding response OmpR family regulator
MPANARLLIVDDEPMILDLMTSTLEAEGFETY